MDDEELEKEQQQAKHDEASQKTAHVAGKAAATYLAPGVGGAIYNAASQTKVGQEIEKAAGKALQYVPGANKAMDKLDDSGSLDAVDRGLDVASGKVGKKLGPGGKGLENLSEIPAVKSDVEDNNMQENANTNPISSFGEQDSNENHSNDLFSIFGSSNQKKKLMMIGSIASIVLVLVMVISAAASFLYPLQVASDFVKGIWDGVVSFFTGDERELEEEFYQELKDVQQEFNKDYQVCIDVNLITASLMVNQTFDKVIEGGNEIDENGEDIEDSEGNKQTIPYKKMKKQIRLLAKMQIMTSSYELDDTGDSYCSDHSEIIPIKEGEHDSSTFELIASHDMNGLQAFFTSKVNEEQNNAYYIYRPPFDTDGTCSKSYAKSMLPENKWELSIGNIENMTESVFYWNLVNSFIPAYYDEFLSSSEPQRTEDIKRIAEEIYLLYKELGSSQSCNVAYIGPSTLCPNGITIEDVGTFDFEEYIAGVVSREAYTSEGMEALKAQAVAARTYALKYTDYCSKVIPNSTNAQTFTRDINDRARQAATETAGEVLIDRDGKIFSSQYDSFCYDDSDCPDAKKNEDGTYTVTYTKLPNGEKHTVTLSDSSQFNRITHGQGHAHGMSQLVSYQLAKEGKTYQEILSYFYSDGVEIKLVVSPTNTDGATIITGPINNYLVNAGSSINNMNQYIYSQVKKAGVGTREGVVAAAVSLISGFYTQTGYKLPYELWPSGKYTGYGMDPIWGTNTGRSDYPLNGLDCSGFVSWAIHNGGFNYVTKSAKGWGQAGVSRAWSSGMLDTNARPGDLIYNAPKSENGTTGHIRMIVDVTSEGYVVAEASGRTNGVRINTISFTSTGAYYLVDMSNYYATATKVSDYPD